MAGHIITIIGGKGGVGKSQFAANLAFAHSLESRGKTLLLDFDQKACGDQNLITGIKIKKNLNDISNFSGSIDPRSIMTFVEPHSKGVHLIGMPTEKALAEGIEPESVGKLLKAAPNIYPLTVIDVGCELSPLTIKALEYSTLIFIVVTPDILAVNQSARLCSELTTLMFPKEMIHVIFNQAVKGHPVTHQVAAKQIGRPVFSQILNDPKTCVGALNRKIPAVLADKNGAFSKGVIECVRKIKAKNLLKALERLKKPTSSSKPTPSATSSAESRKSTGNPWRDLKSRIHKSLVDELDLKDNKTNLNEQEIQALREKTKKTVVEILNKEDTNGILNTQDDRKQIVKEVLDEALGLGPLEDLLSDPKCTEIMVVGPEKIFYEYSGKLKKSEVTFTSDRQVLQVIEKIVAPIGRRIDEKTPYVDARLRDGSRVHAIIPPSSIDGCTITIRKFPENRLTHKDYIRFGTINEQMADFLKIAVEAHRNIVVSGGTGSGKTTLINILGSFIAPNERIITCEDSAELDFPQDHIVRLETRPPSLEGDGAIDIRCLVKQTLRMRPDRIVVGECRGGETLDMLQAMGTGHDGSMTTVHSNNPRECIGRLETLVQYAGAGLGPKAIREMIASAVHLIIQVSRLDDGSRRITHITEIGGMQGDVVTLQDIYLYSQDGIDKKGKIIGSHQATGFIPKFIETLERKGYNIPRGIFKNK